MPEDIAVRVEHVSKDFLLPHERPNTLKSLITRSYKSKGRGLSSAKEVQHALKNIDLEINKGEFFGIVGRNGSGKSTLLKILAGIYQPTSGIVTTNGKVVPFIELGVGFNGELTGRENIYLNGAILGFSKTQIDRMYHSIVSFAELEPFMDQKLKNYSSGMQVRLAFSLATRAEADILLIDEVLAVGDAAFQRKCFEYFKELKAKKKTVVFVTHDMNAVKEYCDRAILIDNNVIKYLGEPQDAAREYALLFIDNKHDTTNGHGTRWGNNYAEIKTVRAAAVGKDVCVDIDLKIHRNIDKIIYGLHINSQDGKEVTAMNNRMLQLPDAQDAKKGQTIRFEWRVLNIFNDGVYFITVTFIDDVANTLDWYVNAAQFTVRRIERSTTSVIPPVTAVTELING